MSQVESFLAEKKVLLTGCGGYLARELTSRMKNSRAHITGVDLQPPAIELPLERFVAGNMTDLDFLKSLLKSGKFDFCFHLAGMSGVPQSRDNPMAAFMSNAHAVLTLLEGMRNWNPDCNVVLLSSNHVYGHQETLPSTENSALLSEDTYGATKACGDIVARCYARTYGVRAGIARITNSFGGKDPHSGHLVTGTIRSVLNGEQPLIKGHPMSRKGFLHLSDTISGILTLAGKLESDIGLGEAFNFAPDEPYTVEFMVRKILSLCNSDLEPRILTPEGLEPETEHLSNKKAGAVLSWKPRLGIEEGLHQAIEEMKN